MSINKFYKFNAYAAKGSPYKAYNDAGGSAIPSESNLLDGNDDIITDGNDENITVGGI